MIQSFLRGGIAMFVILPYFLEGVDQRGVSQKEFATLLGVSQGTLSMWEGCAHDFSPQEIHFILSTILAG